MKKTEGFDRFFSEGNFVYSSKTELTSKQIAIIQFRQHLKDKEYLFSVSFSISNKKKCFVNEAVSTGRCGLEGLIWAKNKIFEFEKYIVEKTWRGSSDKPIKIEIKWADNRRKKVYIHGMRNHGYRYNPYQKRIFKVLNNE